MRRVVFQAICDRCGSEANFQDVQGAHAAGWGSVTTRPIAASYDSSLMKAKDLCPSCLSDVVQLISRAPTVSV